MRERMTQSITLVATVPPNGRIPCLKKTFSLSIIIYVMLLTCGQANGQDKQFIQIKTYDQQLQPMKNVEASINGKEYVSTGNKGEAFIELSQSQLPVKTIKIKDTQYEAASWNHSKGVLEVVIRKKNYQIVSITIKDSNNVPVPNIHVTFKGKKNITIATNQEGKIDIPISLDEKINSGDQFSINDYDIVRLQQSGNGNTLVVNSNKPIVSPQQTVTSNNSTVTQKPAAEKDYFKDFDFSKLDSIQSLTVFYAVFKNQPIKDLDEATRKKVDNKFNELVAQLQDSTNRNGDVFIGRISDSSFVKDDIKNLLSQANVESLTLKTQRADFDEKIKIINEKLEQGITNLDPGTRKTLLNDLLALEQLLAQNENHFYKNLNDYRQIINGLKEKYFDFQNLETRLSESEAARLEDQRIFRQRLIGVSFVVIVFVILTGLLITFSSRLKKQKKELEIANGEIKRINENLENIVSQRTKLLAEANRELDTFLYRASHDLRSPVCSIIGLCNIALHLSDGESKELVQKVANTTEGMDKLLKKLSIISEINQPSNYASITLLDVIEDVQYKFLKIIKEHNINLKVDCSAELVFYSYPSLVETVISNLIENALFYSLKRDPKNAQVEFKASIVGEKLEFSIFDNGVGIDDAIRTHLFDMFFKGHIDSKGNGLGLYIVQKSVQALEGTIAVESEEGSYTRFVVRIPFSTTPIEQELEVFSLN